MTNEQIAELLYFLKGLICGGWIGYVISEFKVQKDELKRLNRKYESEIAAKRMEQQEEKTNDEN